MVNASYYGVDPKQVPYRESMFTGYRYFDKAGKHVAFPFGFGLSYTTFAYDQLQVERLKDNEFVVRLEVTNNGPSDGAEVVQLYVSRQTQGAYGPLKELKGFAKVFLTSGERQSVALQLDKRSFAFYDPDSRDWLIEQGEYKILLGSSSADIRLESSVHLEGITPERAQ